MGLLVGLIERQQIYHLPVLAFSLQFWLQRARREWCEINSH